MLKALNSRIGPPNPNAPTAISAPAVVSVVEVCTFFVAAVPNPAIVSTPWVPV